MANILQALFGMGPMGRMGPRYPGQIPGIGGGYPGTPPFNPNAPMPTMPVTPSATPGPASAPPAMGGPQWLQKFAGGVNRIAGGMAGGQGAPPQVMQAMLGTLLANSGPAPKNSRGLLQPFGEAMLAGGQARQQFDENEMRRQMMQAQMQKAQSGPGVNNIDPEAYEPASVQKFLTSGDYNDLVPRANMHGRYTPGNYTAESWAAFTASGDPSVLEFRPQYQFGQTPGGGTQKRNPLTGEVENVVSPEQGTAEAAARAEAEAQAKTMGEAIGKAQGAIFAKATNSQGIQDILDIAGPLIDVATGSGGGAAADKVAAFFGYSTSGAQAIASLSVLQAGLMMAQPRMEGPQSDQDVLLYQKAAAQIGDPTIPGETKKAAVATISQLQAKYSQRGVSGSGGYTPTTPIIPNSSRGQQSQGQSGGVNWNDL